MPGGWTLDPGDTQVCWGLAARPDSQSTEKATGHWATGMPLSFSGWRLAPPPPGYTHRSLVPPAQPLGSGAVLTSSMAHSVFPGGGEHPAPGRPPAPALGASALLKPVRVPPPCTSPPLCLRGWGLSGEDEKKSQHHFLVGRQGAHPCITHAAARSPESDTPLRKWVFNVAMCAGTFSHRGRRTGGHPDPWTQASLLEVPAGTGTAGRQNPCIWAL